MKKNFDKHYTRKKLSIDNEKDLKIINAKIYQDYLREKTTDTKENLKVNPKYLENIFTNKIYYKAMKSLYYKEKLILYLYYLERKMLKEICKTMKLSKNEVVRLKLTALNHFKKNVKLYQNFQAKRGK